MKSKIYIVFAIALTYLLTCSIYEPEIKTGSIAIRLMPQGGEELAKGMRSEEVLSSVRCHLKRGDKTVHDKVYWKSDASFHIQIQNLEQAENYAVRLYGRDKFGCAIGTARQDSIHVVGGEETSIELTWKENLELGTVTDIDGNVYTTTKIGDQWWMAENLRVTRYQDGEPIPELTDAREWYETRSGAWCAYNNDPANVEIYGRLYNWYAATDAHKLAPAGWHIPTDEEWKKLEMTLGMSPSMTNEWGSRGTDEGDKMKSIGTLAAGTGLWSTDNQSATNETCFSALPGGWRIYNGIFYSINRGATFWSASDYDERRGWSRSLSYRLPLILRSYGFKERGFAVRCVMD